MEPNPDFPSLFVFTIEDPGFCPKYIFAKRSYTSLHHIACDRKIMEDWTVGFRILNIFKPPALPASQLNIN